LNRAVNRVTAPFDSSGSFPNNCSTINNDSNARTAMEGYYYHRRSFQRTTMWLKVWPQFIQQQQRSEGVSFFSATKGGGFVLFTPSSGLARFFLDRAMMSAVTRRRGSARPNTPRSFSDNLITTLSTIIDRLVRSGALSMASAISITAKRVMPTTDDGWLFLAEASLLRWGAIGPISVSYYKQQQQPFCLLTKKELN